MKLTTTLQIALFTFILGACEVNQSVNTDLITGATSRGDGLGSDVSMEVNGVKESRNVFIQGENVTFVFNNVSGFDQVGGKSFPGLSMTVLEVGKDTVYHETDLLVDMKDGTTLSPLMLKADFIANLPFENNEKYKVFIKIWDKKGKGTFTYEMPFTVKENKFLQIESTDLEYESIYMWNEDLKQVVTGEKLNVKNEYVLILEKVAGMSEVDGNVFPAMSLEITDSKGNTILSNANVLSEVGSAGISAIDLSENQVPVVISFSAGKIYNPCTLKASFTDQNSEKKIDISATLEIE